MVGGQQPRFDGASENRFEGLTPHVVGDIEGVKPCDMTSEHKL
jgi:hypothetical protein